MIKLGVIGSHDIAQMFAQLFAYCLYNLHKMLLIASIDQCDGKSYCLPKTTGLCPHHGFYV